MQLISKKSNNKNNWTAQGNFFLGMSQVGSPDLAAEQLGFLVVLKVQGSLLARGNFALFLGEAMYFQLSPSF